MEKLKQRWKNRKTVTKVIIIIAVLYLLIIITNNHPEILLTEDVINVGATTTYELKIPVKNVDTVSVDGAKVDVKDDVAITTVEIPEMKKEVSIVASYGSQNTKKTIVLNRTLTDEEKQEKEKEEQIKKEKREQERVEEVIRIANQSIDDIKGLNPVKSNVKQCIDTLVTKKAWVEDRKAYEKNQEALNKVQELESVILQTQKTLYPKLRSAMCEYLSDELWIEDTKVKCNWSTITVIKNAFVKNANIAATHDAIRQVLLDYRFDRINYKRSESSYAEYTYFDLKSKKDSER